MLERRKLIRLKFLLQQDIDTYEEHAAKAPAPTRGEYSFVHNMLGIRRQQLSIVQDLLGNKLVKLKSFPRHW